MFSPLRRTVSPTSRLLSPSKHLQCSDCSVTLIHFRSDATWGLGRISSKTKLANQDATSRTFSYQYDSTAGSGSTVYIIGTWNKFSWDCSINSHGFLDTGILISHVSQREIHRFGSCLLRVSSAARLRWSCYLGCYVVSWNLFRTMIHVN